MPARVATTPHQPGRHDPRIVDDQAIASTEDPGQVANVPVLDRLTLAIDDQQTGVRSAGDRGLRDQVFWQIVVVCVQFRHGIVPSLGPRVRKRGARPLVGCPILDFTLPPKTSISPPHTK